MSDKVEVVLEDGLCKVVLPEGFSLTGEFRPPQDGEYFLNEALEIVKADFYHLFSFFIVKKNKPRARIHNMYFTISGNLELKEYRDTRTKFDNERYSSGNYFLDKETAEKALKEIKEVFNKYKEK